MEIMLLTVGKTNMSFVSNGIDEYCSRLKRYITYKIVCLPDIKNSRKLTFEQQKEAEGKALLDSLLPSDFVILLDERGRQYKSLEFADMLQQKMASGLKRLVFIIGGPYGFAKSVYDRGNSLLSLSKMTFNHEMVRLFFTEQVYRAMTILRGEPYHHE